jgi:aminopeptidase YwaD
MKEFKMQISNRILKLFLIVFLIITLTLIYNQNWAQTTENDKNINFNLNSITNSELFSHMEFLVKKCNGRGNGQEGLQIAARYIADQFKRFNLMTENDSTGYFQNFNWLKYETIRNVQTGFRIFHENGQSVQFKNRKIDFEPSIYSANGRIEGKLIFAGYGITKNDYDDYKDLDVKDKIVCIMRQEPHNITPSSEDNRKMSNHAKLITKIFNAQKHGAKGLIIFTDPITHEKYYKDHGKKNFMYEFAQPTFWKSTYDNITIPVIYINYRASQVLFKNYDISQIQKKMDDTFSPNSFELVGLKVDLEVNIKRRFTKIQNIVGILEGSDPILKNELIVVGAHYDHDGIRRNRIYPGADDNASGTAAIIEIAKALKLSKRPRRTIVLIAFAAEEPKGGLGACVGSEYYLETLDPTKKIFCMINFDMIGREQPNEIFVSGIEYCNKLKTICFSKNREIGLELKHNVTNGRNPMLAGDHSSFFRKKIPIISFYDDMKSDLHETGDIIDKINFDKMTKVTKLGYLIASELANLEEDLVMDHNYWFNQYKRLQLYNQWF